MNDRPKVVVRSGDFGVVWLLGWMFTIGFLKLAFGKAVLGILIWPYLLGVALRR